MSTAIIDQVMLSGANFLVSFLLIRMTTDFVYGLYVLVQSALLLVLSAQGAWISGPLAVVAPHKSPPDRRVFVGAITQSQRRMLRLAVPVALLVCIGGYLAGAYRLLIAEVLACAVFAAWGALHRDYLRNLLLVCSKPRELLRGDALYVVVLVPGVLAAALWTRNAIVWTVLVLAVSAWAGAAFAHRSLARDPGWASGDSRAAWREIRKLGMWSLAGSVIYWLFAQSYSYVLATRLDLKAVADVNEARILLMPAFILAIGLQRILTPTAAKWYAEAGFRRLIKRLMGILLVVGALEFVYFAFVWIFRGWLVGDLLHKHIADRDPLLLLWALVALTGLLREVLQCALIALGNFQATARQVAVSAVVALSLMWFGISWWGAIAVLIGQVAGEVVNIAGLILLLRAQVQAEPAAASG